MCILHSTVYTYFQFVCYVEKPLVCTAQSVFKFNILGCVWEQSYTRVSWPRGSKRASLGSTKWASITTTSWATPKTVAWATLKNISWTTLQTISWTTLKTFSWTTLKTISWTTRKTISWTTANNISWATPKTISWGTPKTISWATSKTIYKGIWRATFRATNAYWKKCSRKENSKYIHWLGVKGISRYFNF